MDTNAIVAAALQDMAAVQTTKPREWAYKQAAGAIRMLESPIQSLAQRDGTLPKIPYVGPASTRIILEVLATGCSDTVERAVDESGRRKDIEQKRSWRSNFLSRAAALETVRRDGAGIASSYRADFQMHSTWSDGRQTLDDMVAGCLARGYTHAAVTDHSGGQRVPRGLSSEQFAAQRAEIARMNRELDGRFRLLQGVEANILPDGVLDVDGADRRRLDLVVAAPHSGLRTAESQTSRMLAVVRAPGVHILGHPRGRKYGARPGIAADWGEVFAAAADSGVAIEIDGDPSRQDLDFALARQAVDAGCLIALDSDAHGVQELAYVELAMAHAALARVPVDRIINSWPLDRVLTWADDRRAG